MATESTTSDDARPDPQVVAAGTDDEPIPGNRRVFSGWRLWLAGGFAAAYAFWHVYTLNVAPMETWAFRISHVMGALILGFLIFAAQHFPHQRPETRRAGTVVAGLCALPLIYAIVQVGRMHLTLAGGAPAIDPAVEVYHFGIPVVVGTAAAVFGSWLFRGPQDRFDAFDLVLILAAVASSGYLLVHLDGTSLRMRAGTPFASPGNLYAALAGVLLILELTRRVAGLALVVIALLFIGYAFAGPWLPGFLAHQGFEVQRFFSYLYTDAGILGPTTAVSSTYIILFIIFAAFLQASKVGDYFVNFAFSLAGRARGGPAKVAIFASGLMGMINGTSAGNVVATGSLTIPLMKRIGYPPKSAGAVEAAASTGGQIMPPIMGAGAFIMAEITGIPYTEIAVAAIIPAILYFASVYFMVDFEAGRRGMRGMREEELPRLREMLKRVFLFLPILILIFALFQGYSVIRAGTLAMAAAAVVSWLTPFRMGPRSLYRAFEMGGSMSVQIIAVCACAGIIVGVISLTGVGQRFSNLLLALAEGNQLIALGFAMLISILLGMGMPTTAAYAVAASVVAPGLVEMGIQPLTAHFFVFYFAVISAITPPVALASYAAAGISGGNAMETSVTSFKIGLAAFIVPFMFFYNPALLFDGATVDVARALLTACIGVALLAGGVQAYFFGRPVNALLRVGLILAALFMIEGGWVTDLVGIAVGAAVIAVQRLTAPPAPAQG